MVNGFGCFALKIQFVVLRRPYGANTVCSYFCCELSPLNISKLRAGAGAAVVLAGYAGPPLRRI